MPFGYQVNRMVLNNNSSRNAPIVVGTGLVVLDIIINNGKKIPIFNVGGTCANVLAGLSFYGWESIAVSRAGLDAAGDLLVQDLIRNGMTTEFISREGNLKTPRIIERLKSDGIKAKHNFLLRCPSCETYLPSFRSPRLDSLATLLSKYPCPDVYFFDRVTPSSLKLAKFYRNSGSLVVFEPNTLKYSDKLEEAIRLCHVLKYAGEEYNAVFAEKQDDAFFHKIESFCPELVIKTVGKFGLLYKFKGDIQWIQQKGVKPDHIYDSCGAGDWCTSSFIFGLFELSKIKEVTLLDSLLDDDSIKKSLRLAQKVASISLNFIGARGLSNTMTKQQLIQEYQVVFRSYTADINYSSKNLSVNSQDLDKQFEDEKCPLCLM